MRRWSTSTIGIHMSKTPGTRKRLPQASSDDQSHHFAYSNTWATQMAKKSHASERVSDRCRKWFQPIAPSKRGGEKRKMLLPAEKRTPNKPTSSGFEKCSSA